MSTPLQAVVGEVERHVAEAGWDQPAQLFALVPTQELLRAEPQLAATMGLVDHPGSLTPIAQEALAEGPLDTALSGIVFSSEVLGVVLVHEVIVLPPAAEAALADVTDAEEAARLASEHADRREVRMVVGVARGGEQAAVLRLRAVDAPDGESGGEAAGADSSGPAGKDERVTGPDLAPALAAALLATLAD